MNCLTNRKIDFKKYTDMNPQLEFHLNLNPIPRL